MKVFNGYCTEDMKVNGAIKDTIIEGIVNGEDMDSLIDVFCMMTEQDRDDVELDIVWNICNDYDFVKIIDRKTNMNEFWRDMVEQFIFNELDCIEEDMLPDDYREIYEKYFK